MSADILISLATPENLEILKSLYSVSWTIAMAGALFFSLYIASICSWRSSPSHVTGIFGVVLLVFGVLSILGCQYGIDYINNNRPFEITPAYEYNQSTFQQIASLKDNSVTNGINGHGAFFLGCGGMTISGGNTIPVYVFYKKMPDEEYIQGSIPSENVYIKEDGGDDPKIEWIYHHSVTEKKVFGDNGETIGGSDSNSLIKTVIHIPVGTVKVDYNLDAGYGG